MKLLCRLVVRQQNDTSVSVAVSIDRESMDISVGNDGITISMDSNSNMGQLQLRRYSGLSSNRKVAGSILGSLIAKASAKCRKMSNSMMSIARLPRSL